LQASAKRDLSIIIAAGFLRAMTVGFIGVTLAVLLFRRGFTNVQIGVVIGAGLAGAATATSLSAVYVDRIGRRGSLALLSMLATVPIFALAGRSSLILSGIVSATTEWSIIQRMATYRSHYSNEGITIT
jgi:MFS family permease